MKYKIIEREDYSEQLGFRFFIDRCEDESGNIVYCLVARDTRIKEEICLFENNVFITYTQINKEMKDFLLKRLVEYLWVKADFRNLENIKIKQLDDGIKINDKVFKIANDFDALFENTTDYIINMWEIKEYGGVLKWD